MLAPFLLTLLAALALVLAVATALRTRTLLIDRAYGCLTRSGIERIFRPGSDVIFLDLDAIHALNTRHGMPEVDRRIARALAATTRRGEIVAGRWYSGDELVVLAPAGVGVHVAGRLAAALAVEGMSACMAVIPAAERLASAAQQGLEDVQAQKRARAGTLTLKEASRG
jgi:GGDEF domain-containing protein